MHPVNRIVISSFLVALGIVLFGVPSAPAQDFPNSHMYLSVAPDHYDPGLNLPWEPGEHAIYVVVDNPSEDWKPGDAYNGVEFGIDYPAELFYTAIGAPDSPYPLIIGTCSAGRCDYGIGTGGPVEKNPWSSARLQFLFFAPLENLVFLLDAKNSGSPSLGGNPGWALYDVNNPPLFAASTEGTGSGDEHKPDWRAGVLLINYNPLTLDPDVEADLAARVQDPGHPLWLGSIDTDAQSWGSLKAKF